MQLVTAGTHIALMLCSPISSKGLSPAGAAVAGLVADSHVSKRRCRGGTYLYELLAVYVDFNESLTHWRQQDGPLMPLNRAAGM